MAGAPDFQRTLLQAGDAILADTAATLNAPYASAVIYVGNWSALSLRALANANLGGASFTVGVSFYTDQAATQLVQSFSWITADQIPIFDSIGVVAPWCKVTIAPGGVPANRTATVIVTPYSGSSDNNRTNAPAGMALISSLTVNAGVSTGLVASYVTSGQATITASMIGTNRAGQVWLWSYDGAGGTAIIWGHTFAAADTQNYTAETIWIPSTKLELRAQNQGANPLTLNFYLGAST